MISTRQIYSSAAYLAFVCLCASGYAATAAEMVIGRIEQRGRVVLEGWYDVPGNSGAGSVWAGLSNCQFEEVLPLRASGDHIILNGEVRLIADRGNLGSFVAEVSGLELTRCDPDCELWAVSREEVTRTARAAGVDLPLLYSVPRGVFIAVVIILAIVVLTLARYSAVRRRRPRDGSLEPVAAPDRRRYSGPAQHYHPDGDTGR